MKNIKYTTLALFMFQFFVVSQNTEIKSPCDCIEIEIKSHEMSERGISEFDINKIHEKSNNECMELKRKLGSDFERQTFVCSNYTKLFSILSGVKLNDEPINEEVCNCMELSVEIVTELNSGKTKEFVQEKYKRESDECDKLKNNYSNEKFSSDMIKCDTFGKYMQYLMDYTSQTQF